MQKKIFLTLLAKKLGFPQSLRVGMIVFFVFIFLVAIELLGESLQWLSKEQLQSSLYAINNPFVGLFIGLLVAALLQSSSAVTSLTVAFVASNTLNLSNAIPIVMGANIGTTITCIIVAFGHITSKKEFKRAIAVALTHNFFNIFTACILFPLEYLTNILSKTATFLANILSTKLDLGNIDFLNFTILPVAKYLAQLSVFSSFLPLVLAIFLILVSIRAFSKLSHQIISPTESKLESLIFGTPFKALISGTLITAAIRSSSATTSLVVPLVAANRLSISNAFCFIMGANVGTTVTALLAALSKSEIALSIALVHLLFNLFGVLLFFPIPFFQNFLLICARTLGKWSFEYRLIGFAYLLLIFFLFPFLLILLTKK
jgi:sodium-dependent phosphate cotransporter